MARQSVKTWERTISPELHEVWKKLRRIGDPPAMAKELKVSRPTIDKALMHGYVAQTDLVDKINGYFQRRLEREKEQAKALQSLSDSVI